MTASYEVDMSGYDLRGMIAAWEPPSHPHCSNCRNCVVGGEPNHPNVSCAAGLGVEKRTLWQIIRERYPLGFRKASECPGYDDMSAPVERS